MPTFLRKIIFDTSAINALEADKDLVAITQSLSVAYKVGIPETTVSEVIACPDEPERRRLLDVCKRLLKSGNCIMPFQWIVEEQAKAYQLLSAVYLPYCKTYATNDEGQYKALTAVAQLMGADVAVVMYGDFKKQLFGLNP